MWQESLIMEETNWLAKIIDHEVDAHWAEAKKIVNDVRLEVADQDPDVLANAVIEQKARIAAVIGLGTGTLQAIPGIGQMVALGSLAPEALYLAKMQIDIALVVALLYRVNITKSEAKAIITTCLVLGLGADVIKNELRIGAVRITTKLVEQAIEKIGEKALLKLLSRIGIEATKKGILKRVPLISIPLNATMNYVQIETFGWVVKRFLSPSFVLCGKCGEYTGKFNQHCPVCGVKFSEA